MALIDFDRQSRRWLAYRSVDDAEPFASFASELAAVEAIRQLAEAEARSGDGGG